MGKENAISSGEVSGDVNNLTENESRKGFWSRLKNMLCSFWSRFVPLCCFCFRLERRGNGEGNGSDEASTTHISSSKNRYDDQHTNESSVEEHLSVQTDTEHFKGNGSDEASTTHISSSKNRYDDQHTNERSVEEHLSVQTDTEHFKVVQVYGHDGKLADRFIKHVTKTMTNQIEIRNVENVKEIDASQPLLFLCVESARLLPSINYAFESITGKRFHKTATIVVHVKEEHSLPSVNTRSMIGNVFKGMCFFDVAFLKEKGFYACDMNDVSFKELAQYLENVNRNEQNVNVVPTTPTSSSANIYHDQRTDEGSVEEPSSWFESVQTDTNSFKVFKVHDCDSNLVDDFMKHFMKTKRRNDKVTEIDENQPLLIFCTDSATLQRSIKNARELITDKCHLTAATIVVHLKEEHSLRQVNTSLEIGDEYKDMWIIDVAFTEEKGFYECEMNAAAAEDLKKFIKRCDSTPV